MSLLEFKAIFKILKSIAISLAIIANADKGSNVFTEIKEADEAFSKQWYDR